MRPGGVTKNNLQGELKGKPLSDFYNLMVNGSLYVVIHTKDFPNGEIGGNSFVPMDDLFQRIPKLSGKREISYIRLDILRIIPIMSITVNTITSTVGNN